jgi:BirA family biotin operon repressor/biotin-[acetyl-CoA-carboxylase] ligase
MIPLCHSAIFNALKTFHTSPLDEANIDLICLDIIDSTNAFLKTHAPTQAMTFCCAEAQTAGRGRLGRTWVSPYGENIYVSLRLSMHLPLTQLHHLSLIVGLACVSALQHLPLPHPIQIKWPNDLMVQEKKLGGILIEILNADKKQTELVIGIGINVNQTPLLEDDNRAITSLFSLTQQVYDRNILIGGLIHSLLDFLSSYEQHGWERFSPNWEQVDALFGVDLILQRANQTISGVAQGVNEQGQLIILDEHGVTHEVSSGEVIISEPRSTEPRP